MNLKLSDCTIDLDQRRVTGVRGESSLSPLEVGLLRYLAARPGSLISREELLVQVWGYAPGVQSRAVDKAVTRLRRKLEVDPAEPVHLVSTYGGGYGLVLPTVKVVASSPSFVGRGDELVQALALLAERGQVSIVGPPGGGKTSLARELGVQASGEVIFCDLRRATRGTEVHVAVSAALGIALTSAEDSDRLLTALAGRPGALLVLDNAEQLDASGDAAVARLADSAVQVAVTSRRPVGHEGEAVLRLAPLGAEAARELFCMRARAVRPEATLRSEDVDALTRALDGLPLAIELAAARVRVLEVGQIVSLLEQRFRLLRGSDLDLHTSLGWSWDLLEPWEQGALAQLSVLQGAFDLETAEAVVDLGAWPQAPWMVDVIGRLAAHSLVQVHHGRARTAYDMLESVREYAATHLHGEGREATLARHGAWFERLSDVLVAQRFGAQGLETRHRLALCRADLFAALSRASPARAWRIARALDALLLTMGPADQRLKMWADIPLDELPLDAKAHVLRRRGDAALRCGRPQRALEDLEASRAESPPQQRPRALGTLGAARMMVGQLDQAAPLLAEALHELQAIDDPWAEFTTVANLGTLSWLRGGLDEAQARYSEALAVARDVGDAPAQALCLGWLGGLHVQRGAHDRALSVLAQAEVACRAAENRVGELVAIGNQGVVRMELGDHERAMAAFTEAIDRARAFGERRLEGLFLGNLGLVHLGLDAVGEAVERFSEAIAIQARKGGDQRMEAYLKAWRGAASVGLSGADAASEAFTGSRQTLEALGDHAGLALVDLCEALVDPAVAEGAAQRAREPGPDGLAPVQCSSDVRVALAMLEGR